MADHGDEDDKSVGKPEERLVGMTFNMPVEWHMRFKIAAVASGMSMKELLVDSFAAWIEKKEHGGIGPI